MHPVVTPQIAQVSCIESIHDLRTKFNMRGEKGELKVYLLKDHSFAIVLPLFQTANFKKLCRNNSRYI